MILLKSINSAYELLEQSWGGGKDTLKDLTYEQIERLLEEFDELYEDEPIDETAFNDTLWFERDFIASLLGFGTYDELLEYNKNNN